AGESRRGAGGLVTKINARKVESLVLASAVLALGFSSGYAPERASAAVATLQELLRAPLTGALLLVAARFLLRALRHRIAAVAAATAGAGWAAVGVLHALATPVDTAGITPDRAAIGCVACLAFGTLASEPRWKGLLAYLL